MVVAAGFGSPVDRKVYADDPHNPGALHYMIHAYDDPVHAAQGLNSLFHSRMYEWREEWLHCAVQVALGSGFFC